ncbi:MAG: hypothetical protein U0Q18_05875 [Bryobacteraceae bacterium]
MRAPDPNTEPDRDFTPEETAMLQKVRELVEADNEHAPDTQHPPQPQKP